MDFLISVFDLQACRGTRGGRALDRVPDAPDRENYAAGARRLLSFLPETVILIKSVGMHTDNTLSIRMTIPLGAGGREGVPPASVGADHVWGSIKNADKIRFLEVLTIPIRQGAPP